MSGVLSIPRKSSEQLDRSVHHLQNRFRYNFLLPKCLAVSLDEELSDYPIFRHIVVFLSLRYPIRAVILRSFVSDVFEYYFYYYHCYSLRRVLQLQYVAFEVTAERFLCQQYFHHHDNNKNISIFHPPIEIIFDR